MTDFATAMRRIVTGDDAAGDSVIIVDGPPASTTGPVDLGGLDIVVNAAFSNPATGKPFIDSANSVLQGIVNQYELAYEDPDELLVQIPRMQSVALELTIREHLRNV